MRRFPRGARGRIEWSIAPVALVAALGVGTVAHGADRAAQPSLTVKPGQLLAIPMTAYSKVLVASCGDGEKHEGPTYSTFDIRPAASAKSAVPKPTSRQFQNGVMSVPVKVPLLATARSAISVNWTAVAKGCFSMNGGVILQVGAAPKSKSGKPKLSCVGPTPTHTKLMSEPWKNNPIVLASLRKARAKIQSNRERAQHDFAFDEFSITIDKMPPGVTPEQFLERFARNPNQAANNGAFDNTTKFKRRGSGAPRVGTIYDIDIPGDPGSIVIVEKTPSRFIVQTITAPETNRHPVNGAREFGFTRNPDGSVTFYTRGADRPDFDLGRPVSRFAQNVAWTEMMKGIGREIDRLGGKARSNEPYSWRVDVPTGC